MTEEEEKAIKDCDSIFICLDDAMSEDSANDYRKSYKILKNLIEKQSKEIEHQKEKNMNLLREQNISYKQSIHGLKEMNKIINKKWKDKIKAKIEDILNSENSEAIEKLIEWQSFLEKE